MLNYIAIVVNTYNVESFGSSSPLLCDFDQVT